MALYLYSEDFFFFKLNYLKQEISGVKELKLKQLKSSKGRIPFSFEFLPYNSLSTNKQGVGWGRGKLVIRCRP